MLGNDLKKHSFNFDLNKIMSPMSAAVFFISIYTSWIILLTPAIDEFVVFFVADIVAGIIGVKLMDHFFSKKYPEYKSFYQPNIDISTFGMKSLSERSSLFASLALLPQRRAKYAAAANLFKVIPGTIVIFTYWEIESPQLHLLLFIFMALVSNTFFSMLLYIETHKNSSLFIAKVHHFFDWTDVFSSSQNQDRDRSFEKAEIFCYILLSGLMLIAAANIIYYNVNPQTAIVQLLTILAVGLALMGRIWFLCKSYIINGIADIFKNMSDIVFSREFKLLPLHTTDNLAMFETAFNQLITRLKNFENELSIWTSKRSEEARFQTVGEMAAMFAHELANPIHVLSFCMQEIISNPSKANQPDFRDQLIESTNQCNDLVKNLRDYLKRPDIETSSSTIWEVHLHALSLLRGQFLNTPFDRIKWNIDPRVSNAKVDIPRSILTHVFNNLYRNSITNFLSIEHLHPEIVVHISEENSDNYSIEISDNGSGFSYEDFERITGMTPGFKNDIEPQKNGLGLRLIRRVLEQHGAQLSMGKKTNGGVGTIATIVLPKSQKQSA